MRGKNSFIMAIGTMMIIICRSKEISVKHLGEIFNRMGVGVQNKNT
jgi:hypothetical protein